MRVISKPDIGPPAMCCMSHVRCGGEHPPGFAALGKTSREGLRAPAGDQGLSPVPCQIMRGFSKSDRGWLRLPGGTDPKGQKPHLCS